MIVLTSFKTCRPANVDDTCIVEMEELQEEDPDRVYPYTRLHLKDKTQGHDYILDVVESKKRIEKLIAEKPKV